ncbi:unnamed protein product [Caenorhabditis brenneri]
MNSSFATNFGHDRYLSRKNLNLKKRKFEFTLPTDENSYNKLIHNWDSKNGQGSNNSDDTKCFKYIGTLLMILRKNEICCSKQTKFFRRHCVIAKILPRYEAVLHLDADIGVVNPKRKLEDFLDEKYDITFYDRHSEQEVAATLQITNQDYQLEVFMEQIMMQLTRIFLTEKLIPRSTIEIESCRRAWENSRTLIDELAYTSCVRNIVGEDTDFGKVRILKKGTGPIRDVWLTNGMSRPRLYASRVENEPFGSCATRTDISSTNEIRPVV